MASMGCFYAEKTIRIQASVSDLRIMLGRLRNVIQEIRIIAVQSGNKLAIMRRLWLTEHRH